jgi:hypothetical protein
LRCFERWAVGANNKSCVVTSETEGYCAVKKAKCDCIDAISIRFLVITNCDCVWLTGTFMLARFPLRKKFFCNSSDYLFFGEPCLFGISWAMYNPLQAAVFVTMS